MFYCWHKYQSLTVFSAVGAPWRCGVLTTLGRIAGTGLGAYFGASLDCIIIVVVVGCWLLWLFVDADVHNVYVHIVTHAP